MPKSRKPRKKYKPKSALYPIYEKEIEHIIGFMAEAGILIEKVARGTSTSADLVYIINQFNWWAYIIEDRERMYEEDGYGFNPEDFADAKVILKIARDSLMAIADRAEAKKSDHFVATGDELNAIRGAFDELYQPMCDLARQSPSITMREYVEMLLQLGQPIPIEIKRYADLVKQNIKTKATVVRRKPIEFQGAVP